MVRAQRTSTQHHTEALLDHEREPRRELAAEELAERRTRHGATSLIAALSHRGRHSAMRAIAQWVRAATKMEADYRASSSHGAKLEHQLRRVQALADQRGQQDARNEEAEHAGGEEHEARVEVVRGEAVA